MRIAILADIHANLAALDAACAHLDRARPDVVLVAGDIINRGPQPRACLQRIMEREAKDGWRVIRGNHEDYVLGELHPEPGRPRWLLEVCRHSSWTLRKVEDLLPHVKAWPDELGVEGPDGRTVTLMHASIKGNRVGVYPSMNDATLASMVRANSAAFCVGHTHIPMIRSLGETLLVNAGAVGMPFDHDSRASLAHLEWMRGGWHADIVRLDYDRSLTERAYFDEGYVDGGGLMIPLILDELRHARPRLGEWHRTFERLVAEDHMTLEASIEQMLTSP